MSEIEDFYNFESLYYDNIYGFFSEDIAFYKTMASRPPYLEIFAGTGRIISKFRGGIGLEINLNMLRMAKRKFIKVRGDARLLPFRKHFNTVIVGLNSLLLVPNDQKILVIREARRVLRDKGSLFIDVINGFSLRRGTYNISGFTDGDTQMLLRMKPKRIKDGYVLKYTYHIINHGRTKVENNITIYPVPPEELKAMLASERFEVDAIFGDYDLSPLRSDSEKLLVRARAI